MTLSERPDASKQAALADALAGKAEAELSTHAAPRSVWTRVEELLVGGLALGALLVCSYNVFVRYFIPGLTLEAADEVQVYLVIWAVFLALGLVTAADRHVRADLFVATFPAGFRRWVGVFGELLGLAFALLLLGYGTAITWQTWSYGDVSTTSLRFPLWIYGAALPVGALLMAVAYAKRCLNLLRKKRRKHLTYVFLFMFLALLVLGVPIYLAMGATGALMFGFEGKLLSFAQKLIDELNSQTLLAVPYFVIAATLMERGGVAKALIGAAEAWVGQVRGGLGLVCVFSCAVFAAMCGSSVATAIAMGTILVPAMRERNYEPHFAAGIVGASGTLGILIPPSLAFVVYGVLADESIPRLFLAGVVPGLMQAALLASYIFWYSHRHNYARGETMPMRERLHRTGYAIPAFMVPVIVLGGLYSGIVTLTESAALSAVVAIVLSLFVYRQMQARALLPVLAEAIRNAAAIMLIIAVALAFGHWVTETGIATRAVELVTEWRIQGWQFLVIVNIVLLILGMFLEVFSVMLLTLPVIIPMLKPLAIDPIHFGVIIVINMELALLTPPVGLNLYVIAAISRTPLAVVVRGTVPFIVLMLGLLLLITYVPIFSTWLPHLLMH